MKTVRKWMAALIALVMLFGTMPGAFAMNFWCPDEGLSHKWSAWKGDADACGTYYLWRTCERCGAGEEKESYREHEWGSWKWCEGDEGTCVYEGSQYRVCKRCGEGQDRSMYGDHEYGYYRVERKPTCTEKGKNVKNCKYCGKAMYHSPDALGHDYGEWILVKAPTYDEPGLLESVCSRCGDTLQKEVTLEDYNEQLIEKNTYTTAIDVEIISDMSLLSGSLGDEVPVELKVTNIGETVVTMNSYMMHFENGDYAENDNRSSWSSEDANIKDSYFMPGEEMYSTYTVKVTEADIERGEIIRYFTQYAREFYYPNGEVVRPGYEYTASEEAQLYVIYDAPSTDTVEMVIALEEESGDIIVEKLVESEPENGEYYVEGEEINYIVRLDIPAGLTLEEVVVYDQMRFAAEPTVLAEIESACDENEALYEYAYSYTVTAEDVENGYVSNTAYIYCYDPSGDAYVYIYSDDVIVSAGAGEGTDQSGIASLEKLIANEPENGEYYVLGETIEYEIIFTNLVEHELHDVEITDPLKGGNEDSVVTIEPIVDPLGVLTLSFSHVVTEEDVALGFVENTAYAAWFNPEIEEMGEIGSNTVFAPTSPDDFGMSDAMNVTKEITSTPANGVCYVPGEVVSFKISAVNDTEDSLYNMAITDLLDGSLIGEFDVVMPGETVCAVFEYTVSDLDAIAGVIENSAYVYAETLNGISFEEFSNSVFADCGFSDDPYGILSGLEIYKDVESLPLNGSYYTEGEEISYRITYINAGEIQIGEVIIYDSLAGLSDIASAEKLEPGESRYCTYKHTVTAEDVRRGYVANIAFAEYAIGEFINLAVSDTVYSDTNGIADEPANGFIGFVYFTLIDQGEDFCSSTPSAISGNSLTGEAHFCAEHAVTHQMVQTMLGFAADPAFIKQAYDYSETLWKAEAQKLYTELLEICDIDARAVVVNEFVAFSTHVNTLKILAFILDPDSPEQASKLAADLWRDKAMDLCLILNTAPEARVDTLLGVPVGADAESGERCAVSETDVKDNGFDETLICCPDHAFLFGMTRKLLMGENTAESWNRVRQMWTMVLSEAQNALTDEAGVIGKDSLAMECALFAKHMEAREAYLNAVYPENPEIVAEMMVQMIIDHVNDLCAMNK